MKPGWAHTIPADSAQDLSGTGVAISCFQRPHKYTKYHHELEPRYGIEP
jgi:hypothetical protein